MLETQSKEEILGINWGRPRTSRQLLKIDIYTAQGLHRGFNTRTIEGMAHVIKTQTALRGSSYVQKLLLEAVKSEKIASQLQETFSCLLDGAAMKEATKSWQTSHPNVELGMYISNEVASGKTSALAGAKHMVAQLRKAADDQSHHRSPKSKLPPTFFARQDTTDVVKTRKSTNFQKSHPHLPRQLTRHLSSFGPEDEGRKEQGVIDSPKSGRRTSSVISNASGGGAEIDDGGNDLDDLLFDESSEEEEEGNTEYGVQLADMKLLNGDEEAVKVAGLYRASCDRRRTHPIKKIVLNLTKEKCDMSRVELRSHDLQPICDIMSRLNHIRQLDLSYNALGPAGALLLAEGMKGNLRRLTSLNLEGNSMGEKAGVQICSGVKGMHALKTFNIARNKIGDDSVVALGASCSTKCRDMVLDISYNFVGDVGFEGIVKLVVEKVTDLNAEWNNVGAKGTKKLGEAASKECRLTSLNLSSNPLYTPGLLPLLSLALIHPTLQSLRVSNTSIDSTGGWCAVKSMSLAGLRRMELDGNVIGEEVAFLYLAYVRESCSDPAISPKRSPKRLSTKGGGGRSRARTRTISNEIHKCEFSYTLTPISSETVYNLEDPSLTLELSNVWEHFVGTYVTSLCQAHRSHKVISSFIDGVIFNPNRIAALPHEGSLSMVLEHSVGAARSAVIGRHEGVKMRLDLSNERDREVGISQLIKHLELRMDGGPKNASNAIGLKTSDGGQAMYVSDVKLDGRGVKVGGRGWFKNHKSGILEYKLNESYLRMNSEIRGKKECEIIIADVRGRRGVFLHSLTIDGTNVGAEELERRVEEGVGINGKSEWKTKLEIRCPDYVKNSNPLMAEDEEEEG
ncbi:hypothetical protein TrRE_jg7197, partial [Triparma retinervis]